ncbi:MAG: GNAT family N-acetyltransferase [Planctomycetes bacterium]|nr:GNAT family N-acetyltransferase [Planctomycetota bacterium]
MIRIAPLPAGGAAECEAILRSLPEWFGQEGAIRDWRGDLPFLETCAALEDGRIVGFVCLKDLQPRLAEIHVIAVRREWHRRGVGRALVEHAERACLARDITALEVKTLGPGEPDEAYAGTRAFYAAMGFEPVEETTRIWGQANPCLILRKRLRRAGED